MNNRKRLILEILNRLAEDIILNKYDIVENSNIGAHGGTSGIALFLFYMHKFKSDQTYYDNACFFLESTFDKIRESNTTATICTGIAGACWVVDHLIRYSFIGKENYDVLDQLDDHLNISMQEYSRLGYYDYFHGASGIVLYFLRRIERNAHAEDYIRYFTESVKKATEYEKDKYILKLKLFDGVNIKYDLGLAHGISGIIIILSKILQIKKDDTELYNIIKGLLNYFDSIKINDAKRDELLYPVLTLQNGQNLRSDRIGWCNGDIGVGLAYLNTYYATNEQQLYNKAINIFKHAEKYRDLKKQGIRDACMCHGTAGIANVFRFLVDELNDLTFCKVQDYWIDQTLDYYRTSGLDGFRMFQNKEYKYCYSLLEGLSGIGMTLLSYLRKPVTCKSDWDEIFFLS